MLPGAVSRLADRNFIVHDDILETLGLFRRLLKRTCSRVTSVSSALEVLHDYALYRFPRTHSLTHSLFSTFES